MNLETARLNGIHLLDAAKNLVTDIENGDIHGAQWAVRGVENLLHDADTLAAFGLKIDNSDIMRPRLVKIDS